MKTRLTSPLIVSKLRPNNNQKIESNLKPNTCVETQKEKDVKTRSTRDVSLSLT